jgi:hypothetical protein
MFEDETPNEILIRKLGSEKELLVFIEDLFEKNIESTSFTRLVKQFEMKFNHKLSSYVYYEFAIDEMLKVYNSKKRLLTEKNI